MKKLCIFCGEKPVSKTMEHVIPQWLIRHTGDPSRKVRLGINWRTGELREYSFNELMFPACHSCNSEFAALELRTKEIVIEMLAEQPLSSDSWSILLSWFDKVRIGLWLGYLLLNKNILGITPHFHIESRVDTTDRMLLIYKTSDMQKGIQFLGVGTPFYDCCPTCFGLVVSQFYFINMSTDFLFSRRLGLPYPTSKSFTNDGKVLCSMVEGKKRILYPLIKKYYDRTCTEIYQPIIRPEYVHNSGLMSLYIDDYVGRYFDIPSTHLGRILINDGNGIVDYSEISPSQWIPNRVHQRDMLSKLVARQVTSFQDWFVDDMPNSEELNAENKRFYRKLRAGIRRFNRVTLKKIEEEL